MKKYIISIIIITLGVFACPLFAQQESARSMGFFEKNILTQANKLFEQGKYEEAYLKYEELRDKYPESALAYYGMGSACYAVKDYKMAANRYEAATQLEPKFADAFYWLGNAYSKIGKKSEAINAWNECLKIDPKNENAKKKLGKK